MGYKSSYSQSLTFVRGVLNIDTQTRKGLAQARTANLIDSGLVDVIVSSYFFDSILLFKPTFRGRAFIILRHPVYQLESVFYAQQSNRPELEGMALEEFVNRGDHHDNWLVRSLTNDMTGVLTEEVSSQIIMMRKCQ